MLFQNISRSFTILTIALTTVLAALGVETADFVNPPLHYRTRPLWFWNNATVTSSGITTQLQNAKDLDQYGGFSILPFGPSFQPTYLSDNYFDVYAAALTKAKQLGMKLCVYDEYGFPSGSAGASNGDGVPRFANAHPNDTIKRLDKAEQDITGPQQYQRTLPLGVIMSCVAMNQTTKQRIDLSAGISGNLLLWNAPAGSWKVMVFTCVTDGDPNVDYLEPDACDKYIAMTHQRYFDRFGADFGKDKTIDGVFFDETTIYRAQGRVWTAKFNEKFQVKYGFSPALLYPALWYDIGEDTQAARNHLFGFRAELYAMGYAKRVQDWCRTHGNISATGHQDQEEIINPCNISGDLMKCFREQDTPGIDKIGGNRPAERFYKVVSSAAYNYDKEKVMSETYGAMGNISVDELYQVALDQYSKGINDIIPHATWYNNADVTFLPELSWRNPLYASALPVYNQCIGRMNVLLQGKARHVADVAMLYPIATLQGGNILDGPLGFYEGGIAIPEADYSDVGVILTDEICRDFTFIHPEVLDSKCSVTGKLINLDNVMNREQYKVFIMPGQKTIHWSNLQKIKQFYDTGGKVIATKQLPFKSAEFGHDADVVRVINQMFPATTAYPIATASSEWQAGGFSAANANDASQATRWNAADGASGNQWLEINFGETKTFNKTVTKEALNRITSYAIQYWNGNSWVACVSGTGVGTAKTDLFASVTASKVRIYINAITSDSATISEFEVYQIDGTNIANKGIALSENANGGKSYFLPQANAINMRSAMDDAVGNYDVEIEDNKRIQYIHKIKEGKSIYFLANVSGSAIDTYVKLRGEMIPQLWDPHNGEINISPEYTHITENGQIMTRVKISLANSRATFVVVKTDDVPKPTSSIRIQGNSVTLTFKDLIPDKRYWVDQSTDLLTWQYFNDFIAFDSSDPARASSNFVSVSLEAMKQRPSLFYRIKSGD